MLKLSAKVLPFDVEKIIRIAIKGIAIKKMKRGGKALVTVKKPVKAMTD